MTVVIAIKTEDGIVMGCDSMLSYGHMGRSKTNDNDSKVFNPTSFSDVLLGMSGYVRDENIISAYSDIISEDDYKLGKIDRKYIINTTVPNIFKRLESNGRHVKPEKSEWRMYSTILLAIKDKCWYIGVDGGIEDIEDYLVIGCGNELAIGSLHQSKDEDPYIRIEKAIRSACKSRGVGLPIIIKNTWNNDVKIITE